MNPDDQRELEAVFGPDALARVVEFTKRPKGATLSDRYAENLVRRRGSALPDMRRGKKPTGSKFVALPSNPMEGDNDRGSFVDRFQPNARDRYREPVIEEPAPVRKVKTKSGKSQTYRVALTPEEYAAQIARIDARGAAAREAARARAEAAEAVRPLGLPMAADVPKKYRETADKVKLYALQTVLRQRPRPEDAHCPKCLKIRCECRPEDRDPEYARTASEAIRDGIPDEPSTDDDCWYTDGPDDNDLSQWEIDYESEIAEDVFAELLDAAFAEDARREREKSLNRVEPWIEWVRQSFTHRADTVLQWEPPLTDRVRILAEYLRAEYAEAGIFEPPAEQYDPQAPPAANRCIHCRVDPIQTKKDGLCRPCKTYKTSHKGELPPPKVIASRKRKRGIE